jgi:preprotein translocase subunit SecB
MGQRCDFRIFNIAFKRNYTSFFNICQIDQKLSEIAGNVQSKNVMTPYQRRPISVFP